MTAERLPNEQIEIDRALANGLFAWLQMSHDEPSPPLNDLATERITEVFMMDPTETATIRDLIREQSQDYATVLQLYVSGFEEEIVRQLDQRKILSKAAFELSEACLKLARKPDTGTAQESEPAVQIVPANPADIAVAGTVKAVADKSGKRTRARTTKAPAVMEDKSKRGPGRPRKYEFEDPETGKYETFELDETDLHGPEEQLKDTQLTADPVKDYLKIIGRVPLLQAEQEPELAKAIEAGLFARERLELDAGQLSEEEKELLEYLVAQGTQAYEHFLNANLRLVVSIAKRYTGRGTLFMDLIQDGNAGLIRAVEKFDFKKGFKFSTYATWWIRQSITRAMMDTGRTVRLPVHMVEVVNKIARTESRMLQDLGHEPSPEDVAKELNMDVDKVIEIKRYAQNPVSLNTPIGEGDGTEFGDLIEDTLSDTAKEVLAHELPEQFERVLSTMSERENIVVRMRFGLNDGEKKTLDEIGQVLGLTRERVRQIESKTMSKLRHPSRSHMLVDFMRD